MNNKQEWPAEEVNTFCSHCTKRRQCPLVRIPYSVRQLLCSVMPATSYRCRVTKSLVQDVHQALRSYGYLRQRTHKEVMIEPGLLVPILQSRLN